MPPTPPQSHSQKGCICALLKFSFMLSKKQNARKYQSKRTDQQQ
jgi:hypothetical protein